MTSIIAKSILLGSNIELILNEDELRAVRADIGNYADILESGETHLGKQITIRMRRDLPYERILELKVRCFEEELQNAKSKSP